MAKFVLTAQLQLMAPRNVGTVVRQIQNQLNNVHVNVAVQGGAAATKNLQNINRQTQAVTSSAQRMGKAFAVSIKRFAAFSIATRAIGLLTHGLGGAVAEAIDFEREMIKVAQVTDQTMKSLRGLTNEITRLSTEMGVSSKSILSTARILSQAGLSAQETKIALDALAKSELAPTFENITQTAEGAVAIFNQFGQGAEALEAQLGAINAVAGKFAVEAGDLISVIRRTGGVFKAAGGDLNELIALFTSVRATTRESAESIATGLRTIFTRIQRPRTIEFLKQFGVSLTDLNGKFVGPFEAVKRLSNALAGLEQGDITFIRIAEELGGFRQIGKVIPLLQQFGTAQEALGVAMAGQGSLAEDAAKAQESLAVRIVKVKEEFMALISTMLGFMNILPIPALDGGHALIAIIESIFRRKIPVKVKMAIQSVAVLLLLTLMAFVLFNDYIPEVSRNTIAESFWVDSYTDETLETGESTHKEVTGVEVQTVLSGQGIVSYNMEQTGSYINQAGQTVPLYGEVPVVGDVAATAGQILDSGNENFWRAYWAGWKAFPHAVNIAGKSVNKFGEAAEDFGKVGKPVDKLANNIGKLADNIDAEVAKAGKSKSKTRKQAGGRKRRRKKGTKKKARHRKH